MMRGMIAFLIAVSPIIFTNALFGGDQSSAFMDFLKKENENYLDRLQKDLTEYEAKFATSADPLSKTLSALALGVYYLGVNNKLANQYVSIASEMTTKLNRSLKNSLDPIATYYLGQIDMRYGYYEEARNHFTKSLKGTSIRSLQILCMQNLMKVDLIEGNHTRALALYEKKSGELERNIDLETVQMIAGAYLKTGAINKYFEILERVARRYPATPQSVWALNTLLIHANSNSGKMEKYYFSFPFLRSMAWNSSLNNGLMEALKALQDAPIRVSDKEVRRLVPLEKALLNVSFRQPSDAITELAKVDIAQLDDDDYPAFLEVLGKLEDLSTDPVVVDKYYREALQKLQRKFALTALIQQRRARNFERKNKHIMAGLQYYNLMRKSPSGLNGWSAFWNFYRADQPEKALAVEGMCHRSCYDTSLEEQRWQYFKSRMLKSLGRKDEAEELLVKVSQKDRLGYYGLLARTHYPTLVEEIKQLRQVENVATAEEHNDKINDVMPEECRLRKMSNSLEGIMLEKVCEIRENVDKATKRIISTKERSEPNGPRFGNLLASLGIGENSPTEIPISGLKVEDKAVIRKGGNRRELSGNIVVDAASRSGEILGLDKSLILAVIKAESGFDPLATSRVGASGLMQIMPYTAMKIGIELADGTFGISKLNDPEFNIYYGTYYFKKLLDYYDGNLVIAVAAYNAGPFIVNKWILACTKCDNDEFVEAIPYKETRQYVKTVLANYSKNKYLSGEILVLDKQRKISELEFTDWHPY